MNNTAIISLLNSINHYRQKETEILSENHIKEYQDIGNQILVELTKYNENEINKLINDDLKEEGLGKGDQLFYIILLSVSLLRFSNASSNDIQQKKAILKIIYSRIDVNMELLPENITGLQYAVDCESLELVQFFVYDLKAEVSLDIFETLMSKISIIQQSSNEQLYNKFNITNLTKILRFFIRGLNWQSFPRSSDDFSALKTILDKILLLYKIKPVKDILASLKLEMKNIRENEETASRCKSTYDLFIQNIRPTNYTIEFDYQSFFKVCSKEASKEAFTLSQITMLWAPRPESTTTTSYKHLITKSQLNETFTKLLNIGFKRSDILFTIFNFTGYVKKQTNCLNIINSKKESDYPSLNAYYKDVIRALDEIREGKFITFFYSLLEFNDKKLINLAVKYIISQNQISVLFPLRGGLSLLKEIWKDNNLVNNLFKSEAARSSLDLIILAQSFDHTVILATSTINTFTPNSVKRITLPSRREESASRN